jgi:lysine N6-hydroxylase
MEEKKIYGLIGVGIGPFNLGLAALAAPLDELDTLFFDKREKFDWHPGLMFDDVTLQTPFLCDCVSMADPTSPFSFLNFLKQTGRLYRFFIRENFFVLRKEYNLYCQWVAQQLAHCVFSSEVLELTYSDGGYQVRVKHLQDDRVETYHARKLVLGTGTKPSIPAGIPIQQMPHVSHTAHYLYNRDEILKQPVISIVGSGQSAAEVFIDLLRRKAPKTQLNWLSRPDRFYPMEYAKLTLELTSPDYVDYFYHMPLETRRAMLDRQKSQFKGINYDLINEIYDELYQQSVGGEEPKVYIQPNAQLEEVVPKSDGGYCLQFTHVEQGHSFSCDTDCLILATGYSYQEPACLPGIEHRLKRLPNGQFDVSRNYAIDRNGSEIYVQHAEVHTHSYISTDLGMSAYRNSQIINDIVGKTVYQVEKRIAFQQFGVDQSALTLEKILSA